MLGHLLLTRILVLVTWFVLLFLQLSSHNLLKVFLIAIESISKVTTLLILARIIQSKLLTLCHIHIVLHFAPFRTGTRRITIILAGRSHLTVLIFSHYGTTDHTLFASKRCTLNLLFRTQQMLIKSWLLLYCLSFDNTIPSLIRRPKLLKLIIKHLYKKGLLGILFN